MWTSHNPCIFVCILRPDLPKICMSEIQIAALMQIMKGTKQRPSHKDYGPTVCALSPYLGRSSFSQHVAAIFRQGN